MFARALKTHRARGGFEKRLRPLHLSSLLESVGRSPHAPLMRSKKQTKKRTYAHRVYCTLVQNRKECCRRVKYVAVHGCPSFRVCQQQGGCARRLLASTSSRGELGCWWQQARVSWSRHPAPCQHTSSLRLQSQTLPAAGVSGEGEQGGCVCIYILSVDTHFSLNKVL